MRMWLIAALAAILVLDGLLPVPARSAPAVDITALTAAIARRHVEPRYRAFAEATRVLDAAAADRCAGGAMEPLHAAYTAALDAWMAVQHVRFGPVLRHDRHVRIEYWPDKHNQLSRQLSRLMAAGNRAALAPDRFAGATVALQGFPALERLLYGERASGEVNSGTYGCALARAITRGLATIAADLSAEWRDVEPGPAMAEGLVDGLLAQLQVVGDLKLLRPLGAKPENARPRLAENWRSRRTGRNVRINLEALADLYSGGSGADLREAVAAADDGRGLLQALDDGFAVAVATAQRLGEDFAPDLDSGKRRRTVRFLGVHLDGLREQVATTIAPAMGVSLGFNSLDGD